MRKPDGSEVEGRGEYMVIDRPHRLVMNWAFDDDPSNEQLIELSFSESEGATTVLMVNSRISTDERRDAQHEGCLARQRERGVRRFFRHRFHRLNTTRSVVLYPWMRS